MAKKRIAFIGIKGLPARAGVDAVVEKIVNCFDRSRYEPVVYVSRAAVPAGATYPGVELVRLPALSGKFTSATSLFFLAALHALFLGDYDLINIHSVETAFVLPLLRLRYHVVATAHGLGSRVPDELNNWGKGMLFFRLVEYPFMFLANIRTSVSQPDREYLEARYGREVRYIPVGIDLPELRRDAARAFLNDHGLEPGKYLIFTAGRNIPRKGCHFVLEALQGMDDDIRLLIIGDSRFDPAYHERLLELADDRVRFGGFIADKGLLFALIQMSRLFLFPTTYEAMAATMLEVAALQTPLLASDLPENRAILPHEALYFAPASVTDLRAKLVWALDHPEAMAELAAAAAVRVRERHQWGHIIRQYEECYEACLR